MAAAQENPFRGECRSIDVDEVTQIFERVNQEGKKLDPVDIIVARTYRNEIGVTQLD